MTEAQWECERLYVPVMNLSSKYWNAGELTPDTF